jgi:cGMP-dependent protein kinase
LDKDNVAFPIGHKKNSKFVIVISGQLKNSKNEELIGRPLDILYEEELLSLSEDKIQYAINPSPDVLFFEGDVSQILKYLQCKSFHDILNKSLIFEHLSKMILFKSFSQLKLDKLINLIHIEQYKNGEKIIKEGQKSDKFYIVKKGQVEVFQKKIYLRTLNSMEYFGEKGLLENDVRSATVIAKNNVDLYCLDKDSFNLNLSVLMSNYLHKSLSLHDETVTLDDLLFLKNIGKGSYGSVSLVMNERTQFPYAIKAISKNHIIAERLHNHIQLEKNILLKIDHPFIVKLVKCLKDKTNIYFLMEYIKGKVLFEVIRDIGLLNKELTNFYIASMIMAIHYLHERKIIYRDIKPENIIIKENGYLKLIDFGTAKEIEDRTKTIIGTPHYMAPEIIMGGGYSFQVDYWSISICMYEFMCGGVPFADREEDPMEIYFEIINNHLTFPTNYVKIDKDFKHLMKKMLDKNPSYRLANFYSIKNNIWFKDFKWDELSNLNLKAPYLPIIPFDPFDFDVHCKPIFEYKKQDLQKYVDFIQKNTTNFELKEKIPKDKLIEYKKWFDRF